MLLIKNDLFLVIIIIYFNNKLWDIYISFNQSSKLMKHVLIITTTTTTKAFFFFLQTNQQNI